jgi:hypothetical protein
VTGAELVEPAPEPEPAEGEAKATARTKKKRVILENMLLDWVLGGFWLNKEC